MTESSTTSFSVRTPDWADRVRDSFARQPFMAHLGARLAEMTPGRVVIEADHGERLRAVGQVVRSGRTITFCTMEVFNRIGGEWRLCATGQQTLICLAGRPGTQKGRSTSAS